MNKKFYIILMLLIIFSSCNKDDDGSTDQQPPSCVITHPADSSMIQIGEVVLIVAEINGFDTTARVRFSIDTAQVSEDMQAPFSFKWNTEGMEEGSHTIKAEAYEPGILLDDRITIILIDTIIPLQAPVAIISISPDAGNTDSIFRFDASLSHDLEDDLEDLLFRWDFDGDGSWDTEFSEEQDFLHKYTHSSNYMVKLEVMDTDEMTSDTIMDLLVIHSGVPGACGGYVSIPHGGQVYHTVSIGDQCWLRENMNIGTMIEGGLEMSDNDTIEKYCFENDTVNCDKYGGLYQWDEMMKYFPLSGTRGICPSGWHIPSDNDWKKLEAFVDSHYDIEDEVWDDFAFRGFDAGKNLKSLFGWDNGGNGNNLHDFKALPAGFWQQGHNFSASGSEAHFWSSDHDSGANGLIRILSHEEDRISRSFQWDKSAVSVRCLKD